MRVLRDIGCLLFCGWWIAAGGNFCVRAVALQQQGPPSQEIPKARLAEEFETNRTQAKRYLSANQTAQAIPFLERARAIKEEDVANGYDLAEAYLQTGQLEKARAEAQRLMAIRDAADVHTLLGDIATAAHEPKEAVTQYQISAQMDPSEDRVFDFGTSLLPFASDDAIHVFQYGVGKYPGSVRMRIGLGSAFDVRGQSDKAAQTLCEAAELNPNDRRPIDFLANLLSVSPAMFKQVDERLRSYLAAHPTSAAANYDVARNLVNPRSRRPAKEDLAMGEKLLQNAVRLDPHMTDAFAELGRILQVQGRLNDAAQAYERAVKLAPNEEQLHYHLATVYRAMGKTEKANKEFETFSRLHAANDAAEADEAKRMVEQLRLPDARKPQ